MLIWGAYRTASIEQAKALLPRLSGAGVHAVDIAQTYIGGCGFEFAAHVVNQEPGIGLILKAPRARELLGPVASLPSASGLSLLLHNPERWLSRNAAAPDILADECEQLLSEWNAPPATAVGIAAWNLFDGEEGLALLGRFLRLLRQRTSAPLLIQYPAGLVHLDHIAAHHAGQSSVFSICEEFDAVICASSPFAGGRVFELLDEETIRREFDGSGIVELSLAVIKSVPAVQSVAVSANNVAHLCEVSLLLDAASRPGLASRAIERLL